MILAKIIEISDKVLVEWPPKPNEKMFIDYIGYLIYHRELEKYESSRQIADVENICNPCSPTGLCKVLCNNDFFDIKKLKLNQFCYIKPTSPGKCKIVKL